MVSMSTLKMNIRSEKVNDVHIITVYVLSSVDSRERFVASW